VAGGPTGADDDNAPGTVVSGATDPGGTGDTADPDVVADAK
jgi:hypothetical protein